MATKKISVILTEEETAKLYENDYVVVKRDLDIILITYCDDDDTYIYSIIPQRTQISVELAY